MTDNNGLMAGKKGLVMGVANDRSLAWGIARTIAEHGGELAFSYQGDSLSKRIQPLAQSVGSDLVLPCDVNDDDSIDRLFGAIEKHWGRLDFVVHAIAFSDKEELKGLYLDTSSGNFASTLLISCYSLTAISRRAAPLMPDGGSIVTLTYQGAEKVIPHYNVMGVAKAALEASVRYLAADLGGRSRPSRHRVSVISATSSNGASIIRRSSATSPSTMSASPECIFSPTSRAA
jgi:enoyl-[acyl-carrier protein] reductase I